MKIQRNLLRDNVADTLRKRIISGQLSAGEKLDEVHLTKKMGVSRTPLREALLCLQQEGFVKFEPNKGCSVAPISHQVVEELYPVVGALESLAIRLAGPKLQQHCPRLRELNATFPDYADNPIKLSNADAKWHSLLYQECANQRLLELLEKLKQHVRRFDGAKSRGIADITASCEQHEAIIKLIERGEYDLAATEIENHWRQGIRIVKKWLSKQS